MTGDRFFVSVYLANIVLFYDINAKRAYFTAVPMYNEYSNTLGSGRYIDRSILEIQVLTL